MLGAILHLGAEYLSVFQMLSIKTFSLLYTVSEWSSLVGFPQQWEEHLHKNLTRWGELKKKDLNCLS